MFFMILPVTVKARIISTSETFLRDYERLMACREISNPFRSQRLWTTQTIFQQIQSIDPKNPKGWCSTKDLEQILNRLKAGLGENIFAQPHKTKIKAISRLTGGYHFLSGGHSAYTFNNRGSINAHINTFRENQNGRHLGVGHQFFVSTDHELARHKSNLFFRPRVDLLSGSSFNKLDAYDVMPEQGYVFSEIGPLDLVFGRAPLVWGLSEHGGALFSENSRSLDHLQVSTDPFQLPWFFDKLGRWKFSFVFGTLGPETRYPWTLFSGLMAAIKPWHRLELNLGHVIQFGGTGSPSLGLLSGVREFFGFVPYLSQTSLSGANKIITTNLHFSFYELMGGELYLEFSMDDANFSSSWKAFEKQMKHNSNYLAGLLLNCFLGSCRDSVRLEFLATAPITYRHGEFADGWTENGFIIGDPLGPDGKHISFVYERDWDLGWRTRLDFRALYRQNNQYNISADGLTATVSVQGLRERRVNVLFSQDFPFRDWGLRTAIGYEYINNLSFLAGNNKSIFTAAGLIKRDF